MEVLHALALGPAALAVACTPARGRGGRAAMVTGLVMLVAMADTALVPGGVPDLVWVMVLLGAAIALAGVLRHAPPDDAGHGQHLLHVGCLLAMAALTAAMATSGAAALGGTAPGAVPTGHHGAGADSLVVLGLGVAATFVVAGCVAAASAGRRRIDRVGALAGAGSVALMAVAVLA